MGGCEGNAVTGLAAGIPILHFSRFQAAPAEVKPAGRTSRVYVEFFEVFLADVADHQVAGATIKAPAPGIAQADIPNLGLGAGRVGVGIARWNGIGARGAYGDPQHLAENGAQVLPLAQQIVGVAAVTQPDIKVAVGAKPMLPPLWTT